MRVPLWLAIAASLIALAFIVRKVRETVPHVSNVMRRRILQLDPLSIESRGDEAIVVVIDTSDARGPASLIVLGPHAPEGPAALYFNAEGDLAPKQDRTDVADQAATVLRLANAAIPLLVHGRNDELPMGGMTRVHVLARDGWRIGNFATAQLAFPGDPLHPLALAASELIAQLRR
jgi:hypothetical protein